ncbi:cell division protein ZapA [Sphingobium vermicomposti]|uniref:Cell division protein ZapA n=1 Tax=Sphingobium vermicomposti TaxID=529005 RepID=A0A846MG64_9SPHN|nr:cell division protein ZapA [Sphingobium vermicomposti]NIJ17065.1 cell division protein ZapA [Sphingobium vermicomposti]
MAETSLHIAGRHYTVRCRDGEEAHLAHLADLIERKARLAQQNTPGLTEVRTLLFAALFMADELNELEREAVGRQQQLALDNEDESATRAIEALAARIEKLSDRLAAPAPDA